MGLLSKIRDDLSRKSKKKLGDGVSPCSGVSSSPTAAADLISPETSHAPASGLAKTSTMLTVIAQPPPEQVAPSVIQPPNPTPTSLASVSPSIQAAVSNAALSPTGNDIDPWTRAFEILQKREPELMADYTKHLAFSCGDALANADLSSRQSVESIVIKLLENREKKQWRVPLPHKDAKIRDQIEKLAKFLLWCDPLVKSAVSTQPFVALAWSGVSLLLPLLTSNNIQNGVMLHGFNSIGDRQMYWRACEQTYLQLKHRQHYQGLVEPLAKLYSYILAYQARVICHLSNKQLYRAWQDLTDSNSWTSRMEEIDRLDKEFRSCIDPLLAGEIRKNRDTQLQMMQDSCKIQKDVLQTMKEDRQEDMERQLLHDLATAAGDYERYKNINPERVPGTCEWFLKDQRFHEWRDNQSSTLLWISAEPGCGKSVISRSLIDEGQLTSDVITITAAPLATSTSIATSTVCYFFFKDEGDDRMDGSRALCAILHQLFKDPSTCKLIEHALPYHKRDGKTLTKKFSELWQLLVKCVMSFGTGEIICVLDALDECNESGWREVINSLRAFYSQSDRLSKTPSTLKFLVTSRPEDPLKRYFGVFPTSATYIHFDGDDKSDDIRREIDMVIDARVEKLPNGFSTQVRSKISECLKSMTNRTYLWLALTFDIIIENLGEYGRERDIEKLRSLLPSEVSKAYEKILDRGQDSTKTRALLQIVLAAARPLTLDEANYALALASEERRFNSHKELEAAKWKTDFKAVVRNLCGLFITIHDSKLSFIHQTAREFLTAVPDPITKWKWKGCFSMPESHNIISRCCLYYLILPDLPMSARYIFANNQKYPLFNYAALNWPFHYASQEDAVAAQYAKDARMLCNTAGHQASLWAPGYFKEKHLEWQGWTDLSLASYLGAQGVVQDVLHEKNIDVDSQGGEFGTALQAASIQGHQKIVQILLDNGAKINMQSGENGTALQAASYRGHMKVVQTLLDNGANVNLQGLEFRTALHRDVVKIRVNRQLKDKKKRLMEREKRLRKIKMRPNEGDYVNLYGDIYDRVIQEATAGRYNEIIQILLESQKIKMRPNEGDYVHQDGGIYDTALQAASAGGHHEIIQILLDNGADINLQSIFCGTALQAASEQGHKEIVQVLLNNGASINMEGGNSGTALLAALRGGHTEVVKILLNNGANANQRQNTTPLYEASNRGYLEIVQMLLDKGAIVDLQGASHDTALYIASERGYQDIVRVLLNRGASVNLQGKKKGTALHAAARQGYREIIQMLLHKHANVNLLGGFYGTALQAASTGGHTEIVQILLNNDADVNLQGGHFGTALQAALSSGHREVVRMLLDNGAKIELQGENLGTALQVASEGGQTEIVQMLLDNGTDVNLQGGHYGTALHAASYKGHKEVVQMLLVKGANVNIQQVMFGTALQVASHRGHQEIVQMLLDKGANVNLQGGFHHTALFAASQIGHTEIVQMLLDNGADVNLRTEPDGTALCVASKRGRQETVQTLLDNGADVNLQSEQYGTALQAASQGGYTEIVQMLLNNGANVNLQGGDYGTALQAASQGGYTEIVRMLLDNGANVNLRGGDYGTALQVAWEHGYQQIVEMLLDKYAEYSAAG